MSVITKSLSNVINRWYTTVVKINIHNNVIKIQTLSSPEVKTVKECTKNKNGKEICRKVIGKNSTLHTITITTRKSGGPLVQA